MSTIPIEARSLPLYEAGPRAGTDVGLRLALDSICAELTAQDDAIATATVTAPRSLTAASRHQYAAARLLAVGQLVADRFRQHKQPATGG